VKVGLAVWDGWTSPVFDSAGHLLVVDVGSDGETGRQEFDLEPMPLHQRAARVHALGIDVLLCGAVSRPLAEMLDRQGIHLIPFISGEAEAVLQAYLAGELPAPRFVMPGCGRGWGGRRGGRRGGYRGGRGQDMGRLV